jgi:large subunit ribosomal protein L24
MASLHIKKGDTVQAIAGKEKGKTGTVLEVLSKEGRARVEGLMVVKRHLRKGVSQRAPEGGIIEKNAPMHLSNLQVVCPKCNKPSRTGRRELEGGRRVRFCKSCDEVID